MRNRLNTLACYLLLILLGTGCGTSQLVMEKEQQLRASRDENRQLRRQIEDRESAILALENRLRSIESQRSSTTRETTEAQRELREQKEANAELAKEKVKLEGRLLEAERSYEALKKTLHEVQDVAAKTAESFADLRVRKDDLETRLRAFEKTTRALREENGSLAKEINELEEQLKREQAVVRSMQSSSGPHELSSDLQNRVRELENQNEALREEKRSLAARTEALRRRLSESGDGELAASSPVELEGIYQGNPQGLLREMGSFAGTRAKRMLRGESKWDRYDLALAGVAVLFALFVAWLLLTPLRWQRVRRLRMELGSLRRRARGVGRDPGDAGGRPRSIRQRPSTPVVRRAGFSPILSEEVDDEAFDEEAEPYEAEEGAAYADEPAAGGAARGGRVIGAPEWGDDDADEFGNTQVIPAMGLADVEAGHTEASDAEETGEGDATMRLGDPTSMGLRAVKREKEKKGEKSEDLMDELEDLIGKKVDEIIQ